MNVSRSLLLIGSPKARGGTSAALGSYLQERLGNKGFVTADLNVCRLLSSAEGAEILRREVESSSLVILSSPLYVDSLPSPVTAAMEILAERTDRKGKGPQGFLAIVNSGFPEAEQNGTALAICRIFARQAGFHWLGGLPLGGGGAIAGQPLEKGGGKTLHVRRALDLAAEAIAAGEEVPDEAMRLMERPFVPTWLYVMFGNIGWCLRARKNGVLRSILARPYDMREGVS